MTHACAHELKGISLPLWDVEDFSLEHLNQGFYGTVYKATCNASKEVFVLKELREEEEKCRAMFLEEIQMLSKLQHPNVIRCKAVLFYDGHLAYLTEFIEGGTLEELLTRQETLQLPWETYLNIALDVARGMAYLHHKGIIHRDLNSKNILVRQVYSERFMAFVIDLGLSYQKQEETLPSEVPHGPVGSPYHIAPELFNDDPCSQKADVFSFGIILCEMICRCPGADPDELPRTNDFGLNVEELSELAADCPTEYLNLAVRCCQVDAMLRPQFVDIVKIIDIILDRLEENASSMDLTITETFRALDSCTLSREDDYVIEHSVLCTCDRLKPLREVQQYQQQQQVQQQQQQKPSHREILLTPHFDTHAEVYRTSSRRVMRKCVSRCCVCGGRKLEVQGLGESGECTSVGYQHSEIAHGNEDGFLNSDSVFHDPETENCATDSPPCQNTMDDACDMSREVSSVYPAGAVLKKDIEYMSPLKTSQLAEGTPGKLPGLFLRLLRRHGSSKILKESRRRSFNRFFHLSRSPSKHSSSASESSCTNLQTSYDDPRDWSDTLLFNKETSSSIPDHQMCTEELNAIDEKHDVLSKSLSPRYHLQLENTLIDTPKDRTRSLDVPLPVTRTVALNKGNFAYKKKKRSCSLRGVFSKRSSESLSQTQDSRKKSSSDT